MHPLSVEWSGEEKERWSESESGVTFGVVSKVLDLRVENLLCGQDIRYTLWVWLKVGNRRGAVLQK